MDDLSVIDDKRQLPEQAGAEFQKRVGSQGYVPPIPKETRPRPIREPVR